MFASIRFFRTSIAELDFRPLQVALVLALTFLLLTGLGTDNRWLAALRVEQLITGLLAIVVLWRVALSASFSMSSEQLLRGCLVWALMLASVVASAANGDHLAFFSSAMFRQLIKVFILGAALQTITFSPGEVRHWTTIVIGSALLTSLIVIYRFHVLHEVDGESGRLAVDMRHHDPNLLCMYLGVGFACLMSRFAAACAFPRLPVRRLVWLAAVVPLAIAAYLTESRSGMLGFVSVIVTFLLLSPRPEKIGKRVLLSFGFVASAFLLWRFSGGFARVEVLTDVSVLDRFRSFKVAWQVFLEQPFFGIGARQASHYYYLYGGFPDFQSESSAIIVHNTWLQILAEQGAAGFAVFLAFHVYVGYILLRLLRAHGDRWQATALCAVFVLLLLAEQTLPLAYNEILFLYLLFIPSAAESCQVILAGKS